MASITETLTKIIIGVILVYAVSLGVVAGTYVIALVLTETAIAKGIPVAENVTDLFILFFNASWQITVAALIIPLGLTLYTIIQFMDWLLPSIFEFINTHFNKSFIADGLSIRLNLSWEPQASTFVDTLIRLVDFLNGLRPTIETGTTAFIFTGSPFVSPVLSR